MALKRELDGGVVPYLHALITAQQNRGRGGAGIGTYNGTNIEEQLRVIKAPGLVRNLFTTAGFSESDARAYLHAPIGVGHVRYPTSGNRTQEHYELELQPFHHRAGRPDNKFLIVTNSNLANYAELRATLEETHQYKLDTAVDTEAIMHFIDMYHQPSKDHDFHKTFVNTMATLARLFDGDYNIAYLDGLGNLHVVRDPLGIRPLTYAENGELFAVASESSALQRIGFSFPDIKPVPAGSVLSFVDGRSLISSFADARTLDHCLQEKAVCGFEIVYFSNPASSVDNIAVHDGRKALGVALANTEPLLSAIRAHPEEYVVVPVPRTARPAALALAYELGIHYEEGIVRLEESGRTFIEEAHLRDAAVNTKYEYVWAALHGKKVILVDDSIVRGKTARGIRDGVKTIGGAAEVHLRVTAPPLKFPCPYAIDIGTFNELIATHYPDIPSLEAALAQENGLDSVHYTPLDAFFNAFTSIGLPQQDMCTGCWTGQFPTTGGTAFVDNQRAALPPAHDV